MRISRRKSNIALKPDWGILMNDTRFQELALKKFGAVTKTNETKVRKGKKWYKSYATGRWFLYGVGAVDYDEKELIWIGRILYKKITPSTKEFETMVEAMDWVADQGGSPWQFYERKYF